MDLKILKSFVSVATHKSFSAAARELHTVQPAISRHIRILEADLQVTLFSRNSREVLITSAGEQLLKDAKHILALTDKAKNHAKQAYNGQVGSLKIGYLGSACFSFLASLVHEYRLKFPYVHVSLFEMTASEQVAAFNDDLIDIGFSRPLSQQFASDFISHELYADKLVAVVSKSHRFSHINNVCLQQLNNEQFILFNREEAVGLFDEIISLCKESDFSPNIVSQPRHMQTLLTEVSAGLGTAIAPYCIRKLFHEGCHFLQLSDINKSIQTQIHYKSIQVNQTVAAFVAVVLENQAMIRAQMQYKEN